MLMHGQVIMLSFIYYGYSRNFLVYFHVFFSFMEAFVEKIKTTLSMME